MQTTNDILFKIESRKSHLGVYYYLFLVQFRGGARIQEALNISLNAIDENGNCIINGLKGSGTRIVYVPECISYFKRCISDKILPFAHCNRFSAYRHLRNMGIGITKKGRVKASVTHVFREIKMQSARQLTSDANVLKSVLSHNSIKSVSYYGKDSKSK